jgi:repressor LexA
MPKDRLIQKEAVLRAIRNWLIHHGNAPTVEELRHVLGVGSTRTVVRYLQSLEKEGDIERWSGARGIRLLRDVEHRGVTTVSVPLVGEIAAGAPILAEENREAWLRLPTSLAPSNSKYFLLRIRGNSMNRARVAGDTIENGDLVLVRQQPTAEENAIVVAVIDGEATVKRFTRGPGYFLLKPESVDAGYEPILVNSDFQIQGVVTKVIKKGADLLEVDEQLTNQ